MKIKTLKDSIFILHNSIPHNYKRGSFQYEILDWLISKNLLTQDSFIYIKKFFTELYYNEKNSNIKKILFDPMKLPVKIDLILNLIYQQPNIFNLNILLINLINHKNLLNILNQSIDNTFAMRTAGTPVNYFAKNNENIFLNIHIYKTDYILDDIDFKNSLHYSFNYILLIPEHASLYIEYDTKLRKDLLPLVLNISHNYKIHDLIQYFKILESIFEDDYSIFDTIHLKNAFLQTSFIDLFCKNDQAFTFEKDTNMWNYFLYRNTSFCPKAFYIDLQYRYTDYKKYSLIMKILQYKSIKLLKLVKQLLGKDHAFSLFYNNPSIILMAYIYDTIIQSPSLTESTKNDMIKQICIKPFKEVLNEQSIKKSK